jgi:hypothetical protein
MIRSSLHQRLVGTIVVFALLLGAWLALVLAGKGDEAGYLLASLAPVTLVLLDQLGATVLQRTGRTSLWSRTRAPVDVDEEGPTSRGRRIAARRKPPAEPPPLPPPPTNAEIDLALERREFTRAHNLAELKDDPIAVRRVEEARERYRRAEDRRRGEDDR